MENIRLTIKVVFNSGKTRIIERMPDGVVKVALKAVPENGKANDELIKLLSKEFGVIKDGVKIISGKTARLKTVQIKR